MSYKTKRYHFLAHSELLVKLYAYPAKWYDKGVTLR